MCVWYPHIMNPNVWRRTPSTERLSNQPQITQLVSVRARLGSWVPRLWYWCQWLFCSTAWWAGPPKCLVPRWVSSRYVSGSQLSSPFSTSMVSRWEMRPPRHRFCYLSFWLSAVSLQPGHLELICGHGSMVVAPRATWVKCGWWRVPRFMILKRKMEVLESSSKGTLGPGTCWAPRLLVHTLTLLLVSERSGSCIFSSLSCLGSRS